MLVAFLEMFIIGGELPPRLAKKFQKIFKKLYKRLLYLLLFESGSLMLQAVCSSHESEVMNMPEPLVVIALVLALAKEAVLLVRAVIDLIVRNRHS
ncbi:MAG: hypothetical protein FWF11_03615 [Coriobacteriia bacterium]|nr:hypothetical protein [Coriobacteriia bacterium]